jgi:hypothetical protein
MPAKSCSCLYPLGTQKLDLLKAPYEAPELCNPSKSHSLVRCHINLDTKRPLFSDPRLLMPDHHPSIQVATPVNPKGIESLSPGSRGTSYPGKTVLKRLYPNGVASCYARRRRNPVGVDRFIGHLVASGG